MDFAQNALGLPIFVTNPADGSWIRLYSNVADGTIVRPDGTVVPVAAWEQPRLRRHAEEQPTHTSPYTLHCPFLLLEIHSHTAPVS